MTEKKYIEVVTTLSLMDYENYADNIVQELKDADVFIDLTAASVVRTYLSLKFDQWFVDQDQVWDGFYVGGFFGSEDKWQTLDTCCYMIDTEIQCSWYFDQSEKDLAMLFKLTWGGL